MRARAAYEVALVVLRAAAIFGLLLLHALRLVPGLALSAATRDRARGQALVGRALACTAEALGPVFVKLAQMISYRADLLPVPLIAELARLQDRVSYSTRSRAREIVEASLQKPICELFAAFDDTAFAAGSIASVHRAKTFDGAEVAVKVVQPAVATRVRRDIDCMTWLVALAARSIHLRSIPVVETFAKIAEMIEAQVDMHLEASRLTRFRDLLAGFDRPRVPQVLDQFTAAHVLVMEFIGNATPLFSSQLDDGVYRNAVTQLLRALYQMIFVNGLVHCDMHPGNFLVAADGTTVLLDAGLAAELTDVDRRCFRDFFLGLTAMDSASCTGAIIHSALFVPQDLDRYALSKEVHEIVRSYAGRKAGDFLVAEFVFKIFQLQRRYGIYGAPGFVAAIWALAMYEGLVRARFPELDFQREARPFATAALLDDVQRYIGR